MDQQGYRPMLINYILTMMEKWDGPLDPFKRAEVIRDLSSKSKAELEELFSTFGAPAEEVGLWKVQEV